MEVRVLLAAVVVFVALVPTYADLPVHCLNVQVAGTWVFEMGRDDGTNSLRCGHHVPDTNADHFTKEGFNLEVVKKYTLDIQEPNIVVDEDGNKGTWTMIYDEGFEVIVNGRKFFAFSKYVPKTPESLQKDDVEDYNSICDETLVGWYHNDDNTHWGCYHGKKVSSAEAVRFRSTHLQPRLREIFPSALAPNPHTGEVSDHKLLHDVMWEPDYSLIELVNTNKESTWRAGVHRQFIGRRMNEMMRLLGHRQAHVVKVREAERQGEFRGRHHHRRRKHPGHLSVPNRGDVNEFPKHWDWRNVNGVNYDSPVKNQGNCGSCFAMATISVAEARVRVKSKMKDKTLLSSQAVVSCSIYNQGCEGGYPYLVSKHAQDFGLVPEGCMDYSGTDEECVLRAGDGCPDPENPVRYWARNYTYIGGYYGGCNEYDMMKEIYHNGPVMVAFDAPSSLFYYTGGIYTGAAPPHEGPRMLFLNPWEKTNHAVVAVGWGEENGVKFWIIKNTWGREWGENGYFRIRRGKDECGIESMAVTLDMVLPEEH